MIENISDKTILSSGFVLFLLKTLWDMFSDRQKKNTDAMKELTQAVQQLTISNVELKVEMKQLKELAGEVPYIKQDLNRLGQKVRDMES